jgi:4-carboxymuconolactone decarboxylase
VPLIRSPEVMLRAKAMGDYLRFKSALPPRINEMVIIITAREWTQNYEWNSHQPAALKAGLRREIADAIADGRRPTGMAEDEVVAYNTATPKFCDRNASAMRSMPARFPSSASKASSICSGSSATTISRRSC